MRVCVCACVCVCAHVSMPVHVYVHLSVNIVNAVACICTLEPTHSGAWEQPHQWHKYVTGQPIVFVGTGQTYSHLKSLNVQSVVQALLN